MTGGKRPILTGIGLLVTFLIIFFLGVFLTSYVTEGELTLDALRGLGVGVVEVRGVIDDAEDTVAALKRFRKMDAVKAVVIRVESPGGGVAPAQEIYREIRKLRAAKPVIASLGGVAASGGYYVASACTSIVANPGTVTGSIGALVELGNVEKLLEKIGLEGTIVKSGTYKDLGSPLRQLRDDEREILQQVIDSVHRQFVRAVATGRKLEEEKVQALADGRIYSGEQAQQLGLVDTLGNWEDAIAVAADAAGIKGEPRLIRAGEQRGPWWRRLLLAIIREGVRGQTRPLGIPLLYMGPLVL